MLNRLFAPTAQRAAATDAGWGAWPGEGAPTAAGVTVTPQNSLGVLAFTGCVQLIADSIATLPVDVFRASDDGRVEITKPAWLTQPTVDLDFTDWATQVVSSLLMWGNAYVVVTRNGARIVELVPVSPELVTVARVQGRKVFRVAGEEFRGEMLHFKAMMLPGSDVGLAPLDYARQTIGLALAAQGYAASAFEDGLNMPGVIEMQKRAQPEQMREMAQAWRRARSGKKARGLPGVLDDGATWKQTSITPEQAQFLQTRQWTAAEICAQVFLIDPRELGIPLTGSTLEYVNAESREANLNTKGLLRWTTRIEAGLSSLLPRPQYVKLNLSARLRGNSTERWSQYTQAMQINKIAAEVGQPPVITTPEIRDMEDWGPVDDSAIAAPVAVEQAPSEDSRTESRADLLTVLAAMEARREPVSSGDTHIHLPDSVATATEEVRRVLSVLAERRELTAEDLAAAFAAMAASLPAPQVTVEAPVVTVEAAVVPAPQVTVEAPVVNVPAPVVNVAAPQVTVAPADKTTKTVSLNVGGKVVTGTVTEK